MNTRTAVGLAVLLLAGAGGADAWFSRSAAPPPDPEPAAEPIVEQADPTLPVPPVPPRIAEGEEYETCLAMLPADPAGATSYAESWLKRGGGEGATHCLAQSRVALGDAAAGADMLQTLASASHATPLARAATYGQAEQAYQEAGDLNAALGAATLALSLSPDDVDLLVDRAVVGGGLGHWQDCVDDLTHALDLDVRRGDAFVLRGSAWRHLGQLELAQDDIDRALLLDGDDPDALLERGILRQRNGVVAGARADWRKVVTLSPDSFTADLAKQYLALLDAGPERK